MSKNINNKIKPSVEVLTVAAQKARENDFSYGKKHEISDIIRPINDEFTPLSILDLNFTELNSELARGGGLSTPDYLRLVSSLYGDLLNNPESFAKFKENIDKSMNIFTSISENYFEDDKNFQNMKKKLSLILAENNFLRPKFREIFSLHKDENESYMTREETFYLRIILTLNSIFAYLDSLGPIFEDLKNKQKTFEEKIMSAIAEGSKNPKNKNKIRGFFAHDHEVVKVLGNEKSLERVFIKIIKKAGLKAEDLTDLVRMRLVLDLKNLEKEEGEFLVDIAEKIRKNLGKKDRKHLILEAPDDRSRDEIKIEGKFKSTPSEISIYNNKNYERDEKWGPRDHKIYEFVNGSALVLARLGVLKKGLVAKKVHELAKLDCWQNIPAKFYKNINAQYGTIIAEKNGLTVKKEIIIKDGKQETSKFYTISESAARGIIREVLKEKGLRYDSEKIRYLNIHDFIRKIQFIESPTEMSFLEKFIKEIENYVKENFPKNTITKAEVWNILQGKYYGIKPQIIKSIIKNYKFKLPNPKDQK